MGDDTQQQQWAMVALVGRRSGGRRWESVVPNIECSSAGVFREKWRGRE